ncbi:MAG: twin-arginine translocase subunit TatC [Rhodothermales bacterium]
MKKLFRSRTPSALDQAPPPGGDGSAGPDGVKTFDADAAEMSFLEHLEDLRWTIFRALGGVVITTILSAFFRRWIIDALLLGPTYADFFMYRVFGVDATDVVLQNRTINGQFFADWGAVLAVGIIIGSPLVVYSIWRFIEPALYPNEKKGLRFASAFATLFFVLGILFGYLVITPLALQFFNQYSISSQIINEFDITRYFSLVLTWAFGVGLLFELPVVVYFLSKLGLVTPAVLRGARKYALIVILVVGAFLTPPDPISQILVALPMLALYEGSIWISGVVEKRRERELRKALE